MNRFLTSIHELAELIRDIQASDRDIIIAIVGDTGEGKSVFMVHLAKEIDRRFNLVRNLPFTRDELNDSIDTFPDESFIGVDEAVGLFYSRDYHDQAQNALLKKLDRSRDRRMVIALLIPDFFMLDKALRNGRIRFLVWIDRRIGIGETGIAHAFIFKKERNVFNKEPWNLKENVERMRRGTINKSSNYVGEIEYGALSKTEYAIYKEVKHHKRTIAEIAEWEDAVKTERERRKPGRPPKNPRPSEVEE